MSSKLAAFSEWRPSKPIRRFTWDKAVSHGLLPRILYIVVGFSLMGTWIGVMFRFASGETKHQRANEARDVSALAKTGWNLSNSLYLRGDLRRFDPDARSLTVQWSAVLLDSESAASGNFKFQETNLSTLGAVGMYRDVKSIYDQNVTEMQNDGNYYFQLDNLTAPLLGVLGVHEWDAIDTDIDMTAKDGGSVWQEPIFGYPWDEWSGQIITVMNNYDWSAQLNQTGKIAFSFDATTLTGSILNWHVKALSQITPSCVDDTPLEQSSCELTINFTVKRPGIVTFTVGVVIVINWLTTIVIFLLTGESVVLRRSYILSDTDMLGVCFTALFALPTVRSLLPGAPSQFGAIIDLVGILPNVIIISLCTMVFALGRLGQKMKME